MSEVKMVVCTDLSFPRVDKPTQQVDTLTLGKRYKVLHVAGIFTTVINDQGKSARYLTIRFREVNMFAEMLAVMEALAYTCRQSNDLENVYNEFGDVHTYEDVEAQLNLLYSLTGRIK